MKSTMCVRVALVVLALCGVSACVASFVPGGLFSSAVEFSRRDVTLITDYDLSSGQGYTYVQSPGGMDMGATVYVALDEKQQFYYHIRSQRNVSLNQANITRFAVKKDAPIEPVHSCTVTVKNTFAFFQYMCVVVHDNKMFMLGEELGRGGTMLQVDPETCEVTYLGTLSGHMQSNCELDTENMAMYYLTGALDLTPFSLQYVDLNAVMASGKAQQQSICNMTEAHSTSQPMLRLSQAPPGSGGTPEIFVLSTNWTSFDKTMVRLVPAHNRELVQPWYRRDMTVSLMWDFDPRYRTKGSSLLISRTGFAKMVGFTIKADQTPVKLFWDGPELKDNVTQGSFGSVIYNPYYNM